MTRSSRERTSRSEPAIALCQSAALATKIGRSAAPVSATTTARSRASIAREGCSSLDGLLLLGHRPLDYHARGRFRRTSYAAAVRRSPGKTRENGHSGSKGGYDSKALMPPNLSPYSRKRRRDWGRMFAQLLCLVFGVIGAVPFGVGLLVRTAPGQGLGGPRDRGGPGP